MGVGGQAVPALCPALPLGAGNGLQHLDLRPKPSLQGTGWGTVTRGRRAPPAPSWVWGHPLQGHSANCRHCPVFFHPGSSLSHPCSCSALRTSQPTPKRPESNASTSRRSRSPCTHACTHGHRYQAKHTAPTRLSRGDKILGCPTPALGGWHQNCYIPRKEAPSWRSQPPY